QQQKKSTAPRGAAARKKTTPGKERKDEKGGLSVRLKGAVTLDGAGLRCPGRGAGNTPRQLTLMASGEGDGERVMATWGEQHRPEGGGKKAGCMWQGEALSAEMLRPLTQAKPGQVRATLSGSLVLEGKLAAPAAGSGGPTAKKRLAGGR